MKFQVVRTSDRSGQPCEGVKEEPLSDGSPLSGWFIEIADLAGLIVFCRKYADMDDSVLVCQSPDNGWEIPMLEIYDTYRE